MKKNKMMRVASALLVAVLMTTSVISGTFAKYITQDKASDKARVAKWGVVLQADGKLYGTKYDTTHLPVSTESNITVHVYASGDNVVAPGTKSDKGLTFSINGTPEVKTKLSVTITCENIYLNEGTYAVMVKAPSVTATSYIQAEHYIKNARNEYVLDDGFDSTETYYTKESEVIIANGTKYYPVIYNSTDVTQSGNTTDSLKAIAEAYAEALNHGEAVTLTSYEDGKYTYTFEKEYDPNFNYTTGLNVEDDTLTWAWAFSGQNDDADTILANLQAGEAGELKNAEVVKVGTVIKAPTAATGTDDAVPGDYNLQTSFSINIRVEQLD